MNFVPSSWWNDLATKPATSSPYRIEDMRSNHINAVQRIEFASFVEEDRWPYHLIQRVRMRDSVSSYVATQGSAVVGYVLSERHCLSPSFQSPSIELLRIAVDPKFRRLGIGRMLVNRIIDHLESGGRQKRIETGVRERDLETCLFMRSLGFFGTVDSQEKGDNRTLEFVYEMVRECCGK